MESNLNSFSIFNDPKLDHMDLLEAIFEHYTCAAGTIVFKQGEPADYLYLIKRGIVEISYKPYDGDSITITHVEKEGLFGWSAVVGSKDYTSSSIAIEPLDAIRVHGSDLRKFCLEHPDAGKTLLERLANSVSSRWKDAQEQVSLILARGLKDL